MQNKKKNLLWGEYGYFLELHKGKKERHIFNFCIHVYRMSYIGYQKHKLVLKKSCDVRGQLFIGYFTRRRTRKPVNLHFILRCPFARVIVYNR